MTKTDSKQDNVSTLSFEEAMKELEEIVRKLESGNADLESSIQDYLRGTRLQQHCQKKLKEARLKVDSIVGGNGENPSLLPFDEAAG